jgi:hypothetical protein
MLGIFRYFDYGLIYRTGYSQMSGNYKGVLEGAEQVLRGRLYLNVLDEHNLDEIHNSLILSWGKNVEGSLLFCPRK